MVYLPLQQPKLHLSPLTRPAEPDDRLFVQPDVLHTKIVDDAVDHHRPTLHLWLPAVCEAVVEDDRPRTVLSQPSFDLPYQLLALAFVGLRRLPLEQLLELGIAIAGVVAGRPASIVLIELLIGIVDTTTGEIEANLEIFAIHLGVPEGGLDDLELAVDEHLLQLVD